MMAADALRYPLSGYPVGPSNRKLGPLGGGLPVDHLSRRQSIYTAHSLLPNLPTHPLTHLPTSKVRYSKDWQHIPHKEEGVLGNI